MPDTFAFPPGDERLRAINGGALSTASRYLPMIETVYADGSYHGDAAAFVVFNSGPAAGGKLLYVWDTLLAGPEGQEIMQDVVTWVLNARLRPPIPAFSAALAPDKSHAAFNFNAVSNLDYMVQYRNSLNASAWTNFQELVNAPTNRSSLDYERSSAHGFKVIIEVGP